MRRGARRARGRRDFIEWLKDAVAAGYVALLLDYRGGRIQSPKAEAVYCTLSLLYSALYAGRGDLADGASTLRSMAGGVVNGVAAARAVLLGLYVVEGRPAWETLRGFMEGRVPNHWAAQGLVEALEARGVRRTLFAKWMGDPASIPVRYFNVGVDPLLEKLEVLELTLPRGAVEAGKELYRAARRLAEQTPRFVERVSEEVKKMRLRGL